MVEYLQVDNMRTLQDLNLLEKNMIKQNKQYSNLGLIVAIGQNREIGHQNKLIWRIKEDLDFFKKITMDSYIIMGRNTYKSMPKNLKGRNYIVLSRDENFSLEIPKLVHRNIDETLAFISQDSNSKFWVVGGGIIYTNFLPHVDMMHITQIDDSYSDADTFFPEFNKEEWSEEVGEDLQCSKNNVNYNHTLYLRKNIRYKRMEKYNNKSN